MFLYGEIFYHVNLSCSPSMKWHSKVINLSSQREQGHYECKEEDNVVNVWQNSGCI